MIPLKEEECPNCGNGSSTWWYDLQKCGVCHYPDQRQKLSHEDWQRLGRAYLRDTDLRTEQDRRINEFLKQEIRSSYEIEDEVWDVHD